MDSSYAPKGYRSMVTCPVFSHDNTRTGGSFVSDSACYFGGFSVAEHASPDPCQAPLLYRLAFPPTQFSPVFPVTQYCRTPLIDRIPSSDGVGLPATGQRVGDRLDGNAFTSRTQSSVVEPPLERFALVRQKEPSHVVRTFFTKPMKESLEASFAKSNYVSRREKKQLAYELQVTERQVKVWFQNRRVKERKLVGWCRGALTGRPPNIGRLPVQMAGDAERVNCIAQTPLKAPHTKCQDIKPSPDPVRDEEGSRTVS